MRDAFIITASGTSHTRQIVSGSCSILLEVVGWLTVVR